jgi:hypothetical protein
MGNCLKILCLFVLLFCSCIEGPQGIQGEKGETGDQGIQGESGKDGVDGITPKLDIYNFDDSTSFGVNIFINDSLAAKIEIPKNITYENIIIIDTLHVSAPVNIIAKTGISGNSCISIDPISNYKYQVKLKNNLNTYITNFYIRFTNAKYSNGSDFRMWRTYDTDDVLFFKMDTLKCNECFIDTIETNSVAPFVTLMGFEYSTNEWITADTCGMEWDVNFGESGIKVSWDANTEEDLSGYKIYYGNSSGVYDNVIICKKTEYTFYGLSYDLNWFFVVTAYDKYSNESPYSIEVFIYNIKGTQNE